MHLNAVVSTALAALCLLSGSTTAQKPTLRCPSGQYTLISSSSRPATRQCETLGFLNAPSPLSAPVAAASLDECVQTCKATAGCISFGYSARNASSCALYNKRLIDMKYLQRNVNKWTVFSSQLCYSCKPLTCTNVEAVENGGFETAGEEVRSAAGWAQSPSSPKGMSRQGFKVHSGSVSLQASFFAASEGNATIQQVLSCVYPSLKYVLSVYYDNGGPTQFSMELDGKEVLPMDVDPDGNFRHSVVTVTPTPASPTLVLQFEPYSSVYAYLDDVSMKLKSPTL